MKACGEVNMNEWERTRLICMYSVIAMNGTKDIKQPSDLFPLPWDKNKKAIYQNHKTLSRDDIAKIHSQYLKQKK